MSRVFGLTGGIACGKSTVSRVLYEAGIPIVDADVVAREIVGPGTPGLRALEALFGSEVLQGDGTLDRSKLGAKVFMDSSGKARQALDDIMQPLLLERSAELMRGYLLSHPLVCFDAALLVEKGYHRRFRPLVVVVLDEAEQIRRIMQRDGFTESEARARVDSQMPMAKKRDVADYVIENNGSISELRARTLEVLSCIREGIANES